MAVSQIYQGILVFPTVRDALRAGFHVCDLTADGYLVRCQTEQGWALALVPVRPDEPERPPED